MAISSVAYATWDEYQDRNAADEDVKDVVVEMLRSLSRSLDRTLGVIPGGFAPIADATFTFYGDGSRRLWLRDERGSAYPLRSVADGGVRPDYERSGDYAGAPAWDLDDAWLSPRPRNHAALGEPARAIELLAVDGAPRSRWPQGDGAVQISGDWGWDEIPGAITELVIHRVRDMRDSHRGGAAATIAGFDGEAVAFNDDSWRLWEEVRQNYNYRRAPVTGGGRR